MTRTRDLRMFPSEALLFTFLQAAMRSPAIRLVSSGPVPLFGQNGLHRYKLRSGYEVAPCRVVFRLHPALTALRLDRLGRLAAGAAGRLWPDSAALVRARLVLGSAGGRSRRRREIGETGKRGLVGTQLEVKP